MARKATKATDSDTLYCSFCGKSQHEVRKLIAGPTTFICDECVELCDDIIWDEHKDRIIIQIRLPDGVEFDDTLNDAFARVIDENFPGIDFKYECRRQYPGLISSNKTTSSAVYSFSNNNKSSSDISSLKEYLSSVIRELSVTKTKFLTESKKRSSLEKELVSIKDEFLLYLRKDFSKSFGDGEHDLKVVMFLDVSGFSKFPLNEKEKVVDTLRGIALPIIGMKDVGHINMWGDAIVTTFDDPNKGIECAIKFVRHLAVEKLDIRIGMAWGEIRSAYNAALGRKDIDGPIVDFAARLEAMAEVGEILVSDEFGALDIVTSAADIIPHKAFVKKAFGEFSVGDEIDVFKVRITLN